MEYKQPVVIGLATFGNDRRDALKKIVERLTPQCDHLFVYDNEERPDITDLGKFWMLDRIAEPVYYFSCDDDIIYPTTYVQDMVQAIETHNTIITHHGRILLGTGRDYYRGHKNFRCLDEVKETTVIDVAGTGVTAFDTSYFNPQGLTKCKDMKMSDLVFSLEAAKQGKKITVLKHKIGYLGHHDIDLQKTIAATESRGPGKGVRQKGYADEIYKINH